jgi:hypothetical protein
MRARPSVFLNVPFDASYEPLFVALVAAIVALGRQPRCVLEIPEHGQGRLNRIVRLIQSCPVSMHDLSRVGQPVRFNMPFELGIAVCLSRTGFRHRFAVLESRRFRLQKTLSDLNGIDPGIHAGTPRGVISCVLSLLGKSSGNPTSADVYWAHQRLMKMLPALKRANGRSTIYSRIVFADLIEAAAQLTA